MIDLHTHTTASDGRDTPAELVARAAAAGVSVLAVTDHDTVAGCEAAATAAAAAGIEFVDGIEITAMRAGGDVHVLGYFFDRHSPALLDFLQQQRLQRIERVREMVARLAVNGIELNADAIVQPAIENPAKSAGRPWIARALVAAGVVADANEAFAKWLSRGRPGYVPRAAASPAEVFARIHDAGGIASLAHPSLVGQDSWIDEFASPWPRCGRGVPQRTRPARDGTLPRHRGPAESAGNRRLGLPRRFRARSHRAGSCLATARSLRSPDRPVPNEEKPQSHRVTEIGRSRSPAEPYLCGSVARW